MMAFDNKLSLYIPSVPPHLADADGIKHYMQRFGHIKAVDIVGAPNQDSVFRAFVHFNEWYDDQYCRDMQEVIMDKDNIAKVNNDDNDGYFILLPKTKKTNTYNQTSVPAVNCIQQFPPLSLSAVSTARGVDNRPAWMVHGQGCQMKLEAESINSVSSWGDEE